MNELNPTDNRALGSILDVIFASLEQDLHAMRASNGVLLNTLEKEISTSLFTNPLP
jgi:hypothetical protein